MSYKEITVPLPDGYPCYARYWRGPQPQGAVLYHHGIQSHCGWYEASAQALCDAGFAVMQPDRRGCGRNRKDRAHAESAEQLIADAHRLRDELVRRSGFAAYHVVGVSWGGRLAVAGYIDDPAGVQSLSLITPGLFPLVGVSKEMAAKIGFAMLYEREKMFDIPLSTPELFTSDPKWQRFIETDELTLRQATAGFYLASRRMDRMFPKLKHQAPIPLHLIMAGHEGIVDNDKTLEFIQSLDWPETRISRFSESRHGLEFESESPRFLDELVSFVQSIHEQSRHGPR
jgi:acylglycerol lipase